MVFVVGTFASLPSSTLLHQPAAAPPLLPDPTVGGLFGVTATMTAVEAERRLKPYAAQILSFVYRDMAARIRALGATPVFAIPPRCSRRPVLLEPFSRRTRQEFERRSFLRNVYDGGPESRFNLTEWDHHPNVAGHVRIAGSA
jgi:hypothetical protein